MESLTHENSRPARRLTDGERWAAITGRDARLDGAFVYAVRSTGIYCLPSCPSRNPRRDNVDFYLIPEAAEGAGYRPCKRCRPKDHPADDPRVDAVRRACRFIQEADEGTPTLEEIGAHVGLSPSHLQRQFKKVVGISPRAFADCRRVAKVKSLLRDGDGVAGALYEAGYGSASRLYEGAAARLGMTP
ncbi:MAG: Ada metal-binding domain-containing protein, partial [Pseudomonadota bacterium]